MKYIKTFKKGEQVNAETSCQGNQSSCQSKGFVCVSLLPFSPCIGAQIEQIFSFILIQWLFFLSLCFYVSKETAERYLCFFLEQSTAVCFKVQLTHSKSSQICQNTMWQHKWPDSAGYYNVSTTRSTQAHGFKKIS